MSIHDKIELVLPFKAEYVSVARLTVSGIANRMGFDIDTIEDIKVSVAEVCNKLVEVGSKSANTFKINFEISDQKLEIVFDSSDKSLKNIFDEFCEGLSLTIINAFMDSVQLSSDDSHILSMIKTIERISGDGE